MAQEPLRISVDESLSTDSGIYKTELTNYKIATGDKFWIPTKDLFVVFTPNTPIGRATAERIFVVRLDDNNTPTEVTQLFVSQIAKKDFKTKKYVFNNDIAEAHRLGMKYFKHTIAGKILEVGINKQYNAGVWDEVLGEWSKDEEGNYKTITKDNAFYFDITTNTLSWEALDKAIALLVEKYRTIPSITINE